MIIAANGGLLGAFLVFGIIYLAFLILTIVAWVKIITKAGYSGAWVLIGIVPILNIIMFLVFAFSDWPVLSQARQQGIYPYQR
jgi:hypothetical protein